MEPIIIMYFLWGVVTGWGATEVFHGVFDDDKNQAQVCPVEETCVEVECGDCAPQK